MTENKTTEVFIAFSDLTSSSSDSDFQVSIDSNKVTDNY